MKVPHYHRTFPFGNKFFSCVACDDQKKKKMATYHVTGPFWSHFLTVSNVTGGCIAYLHACMYMYCCGYCSVDPFVLFGVSLVHFHCHGTVRNVLRYESN